jgi:hypothetical protein
MATQPPLIFTLTLCRASWVIFVVRYGQFNKKWLTDKLSPGRVVLFSAAMYLDASARLEAVLCA